MKFIDVQRSWVLALACSAGINAPAQTFTNMHNFASQAANPVTYAYTNADGANLYAPLAISGGTLYGVTAGGNTNGLGGLFRINTDGTEFVNLFAFSLTEGGGDNGGFPNGLIVSGNTLYGTTYEGGPAYTGTIFSIGTNGTGLLNLHTFSALGTTTKTNSDGAYPRAGLTQSGGMLYGTTSAGGAYGYGTIFAIGAGATGFTNLFNFALTNGSDPQAALVVSGNTLYGTTYGGGANSNGTIFAINTDGTGFTNLHEFSPLGYPYATNYDGARIQSGLTLAPDGTLYGTAASGGAIGNGYGTIFSIKTNGTGFSNIRSFNYTLGAVPYSTLLLANGLLYGTTTEGGAFAAGTVFSVNTDGSGLTDLYSFPISSYSGAAYTNSTGDEPWAGVVTSGTALFGVTPSGGLGGTGNVYGVTLPGAATMPAPINIQANGSTIMVSWTSSSFTLQATPALGIPFTNVPAATSPYSITPTNSQQYFRLQAN